MRYYITTTSEQAHGISAIKAQQQGCTGTTSFWWQVITHPTTGGAALCIGDEEDGILYENGTTSIVAADLQPEEYMTDNGWFSEVV